jgi:hypothetical protein
MRLPPEGLVDNLKRRWPDFQDVRFNEALSRWEFVFTSAAGLPVSQFYGWEVNPLTGEAIEPDPVTGLLPFRDLTPEAIADIIKVGERTYLGKRTEGARDWRDSIQQKMRHNRDVKQKDWVRRGEDFAYLIKQVDLKRPWVKHHVPAAKHVSATYLRHAVDQLTIVNR